ncbi:MFS transporter [Actinomadura rupiterrae]|uniref:MFS transporter n=1 Tax=Actinomadura rupiterrae TaxID=559627 RepID=UPI0020A4B2C4|nr:MFS transporter [Actinomadura rupiterrae]MCP2335409.1 putative MFS family arabinose efflux permease [Actinomadura rupiterrae]
MATCNQIGPSRAVTALFAVAAGTAVANVYFAQPLLATLGGEFGIGDSAVGAVVTATQAGYGLGLLLLVPLGDALDRRRLVPAQLVLLAAALALLGTATRVPVLFASAAAVGLLAVVTQTLVAAAASLAPPSARGRVVGQVTSGIVVGILLARTVSGILADLAGWRAVYLLSAAATTVLALLLHRALPAQEPQPGSGYPGLVWSTVVLFAREPLLRARGLLAMLIFAAFGSLWSCVALPLTELGLSRTAIGAFGLAGAAGALAAAPAGRLHDRGLGVRTTTAALVLLAVSWVPMAFVRQSLWALALGAILLDLAVQAVHVTSQSMIYTRRPDAGSRVIGGYMAFYSVGSATGAAASTALYAAFGWSTVCVLGAVFSVAALGVSRMGLSVERNPMTEIRPARPSDRPDVERVVQAAYAPWTEIIGTPPLPLSSDYAALIEAGRVFVLDDLSGLIVLIPEDGRLLVDNVAVDPSHQGEGLGSRLLDYAEDRARELGLPALRLITNEKMTSNISRYERRGYRETGRESIQGRHAVHMSKTL